MSDTDALREKAAKAAKHFAKDGSVFGAPVVLMVCEKVDTAWVRKYDQMASDDIDKGRQRVWRAGRPDGVREGRHSLGAQVRPDGLG